MKIIIDTDPGLDDALALIFAALSPEFELLAVTTTAGNIGLEKVTTNALRLLTLSGRRKVPVHPGASKPLAGTTFNAEQVHGVDGLGGIVLPDADAEPQGDAVSAMIKLLDDHPESSITLLALAPLTNIAALLDQAPDSARRIKRIIVMGGTINEPGNAGPEPYKAEFNFAWDPEAAAKVLAAGLDLTLVPLDATRRWRADRDLMERMAGNPAGKVAHDLLIAYMDSTGTESRPLHDPCVPLLALYPDQFDIHEMSLGIDAQGVLSEGDYPVKVVMDLNAEELGDLLVETVSPPPTSG